MRLSVSNISTLNCLFLDGVVLNCSASSSILVTPVWMSLRLVITYSSPALEIAQNAFTHLGREHCLSSQSICVELGTFD